MPIFLIEEKICKEKSCFKEKQLNKIACENKMQVLKEQSFHAGAWKK